LNFTDALGTQNVSVNSNSNWTASSNQSWCTVSPSSGSGNGSLAISGSQNTAITSRTAIITVSGTGGVSQTITVTQNGAAPNLAINFTTKSVESAANSFTVQITSNTSWSVSSNQTWCTVSSGSGSGNGYITINYSANTIITSRSVVISFSASGVSTQTLTLTQSGATPTLTIDATTKTIGSTASSFTVQVTSNTNWSGSSNQPWCTLSSGSGSGNGSINVYYTENTSSISRSLTVTFSLLGASSQTLTITQKGRVYSGTMITLQGGSFQMGQPDPNLGCSGCAVKEQPVHSVTLSSYNIGKYEVTNQEFADFLNAYGQPTIKSGNYVGQTMILEDNIGGLIKNGSTWIPAVGKGNYPVIKVTWYGADEFCKYYGGRLPSEAEWEFAARGGIYSKNYTYSGSNTFSNVAWYWDNSNNADCNLDSGKGTHTIGLKTANELVIYDMSGNVWEWCSDWYDSYSSGSQTNPIGPSQGLSRVIRGGSWGNADGNYCRVAYRNSRAPAEGVNPIGFRFVNSGL
jgi:formylglycine-generating enzyme required for sulfatase activity